MEVKLGHYTCEDGEMLDLKVLSATSEDVEPQQRKKIRWSKSKIVESTCGNHRYRLERRWGWVSPETRPPAEERLVLFVCLNPSTAGITEDDPTLRRCLGFVQEWRNAEGKPYTGLLLLNLYSVRGTKPESLRDTDRVLRACGEPPLHRKRLEEPNDSYLQWAADDCDLCVAAWGAQDWAAQRAAEVEELLRERLRERGMVLHYLSATSGGHPAHPLYLPKWMEPKPWIPGFRGEIVQQ